MLLQDIWENPSYIWYVLYFHLVGGNSFSGCHSCSLSRMPPPVWAPWLNLVQLGNGLLPNRLTNIVTLYSCWLPIPVCYSAQTLDTKNSGAERERKAQSFLVRSRQRTFNISFRSIFHFPKCQTTKMLQANVSNSSLWHLFFWSSTWWITFCRSFEQQWQWLTSLLSAFWLILMIFLIAGPQIMLLK